MTVSAARIVPGEPMIAMNRIERFARKESAGYDLELLDIFTPTLGEPEVLFELSGKNREVHQMPSFLNSSFAF
jgi:hypothetical protein